MILLSRIEKELLKFTRNTMTGGSLLLVSSWRSIPLFMLVVGSWG
jgi:hypothetical protein